MSRASQDTLAAELAAALREEKEAAAFARLLAARERLAVARDQLDEVLSPTTPEAS